MSLLRMIQSIIAKIQTMNQTKNCLEVKREMLRGIDLTEEEYLNRIDPMTSPGTERQLTTMVIKFIFDH